MDDAVSTPAEQETARQVLFDERTTKALGHPLRYRVLMALRERVASPKELAQELEEPLENLAYHVRLLRDLDAIELVRTVQRRGAVEHYYRATMRAFLDDHDFAQIPLNTRRALIGGTLNRIFDGVHHAGQHGGFDDPETHVSWVPLLLDEEGVAEIRQVLAETLDRAMEIETEAANRMAAAADESAGRPMELTLLHFDRAPGAASAGAAKRGHAAKLESELDRTVEANGS